MTTSCVRCAVQSLCTQMGRRVRCIAPFSRPAAFACVISSTGCARLVNVEAGLCGQRTHSCVVATAPTDSRTTDGVVTEGHAVSILYSVAAFLTERACSQR